MAHRRHVKAYSVGELNSKVQWLLQNKVPPLWVVGEISNLSQRGGSGHVYFKLKDAQAQVDAVIWQTTRRNLKVALKDGMEVLVRCKVTLYEKRGQFQVEVLELEERGLGRLQRAFDKLKAKLESEGLFSPERKKPLPAFPRKVALITSPTGAAVRDMLKSILGRCPRITIYIYAVRVQGQGAYGEIAEAIARLNVEHRDLDLLVIGRGGGSIEDLWAFNEEVLARAIARSRIPLVAAIGHEVDTTIADLVADRSVPTPTAVGQVFPDLRELLRKLALAGDRLSRSINNRLAALRGRLDRLAASRLLQDPLTPIQRRAQRLDELCERMQQSLERALRSRREALDALARRRVLQDPAAPLAIRRERLTAIGQRMGAAGDRLLERGRAQLEKSAARLEALSPLRVLSRGYSVTLKAGQAIRNAEDVLAGDLIQTRLASGYLESTVTRSVGEGEK